MFRRDKDGGNKEHRLDNEGLRRMREAIRQRLDQDEPAAAPPEAPTEGSYNYESLPSGGEYAYPSGAAEEQGGESTAPPFAPVPPAAAGWTPDTPAHSTVTTVATDTTWEGALRSSADVRIDGSFKGEIHTAHGLHVTNDARVDATVHVGSAVVAGQLTGQINCRERLEILPTGRVSGQIDAGAIVVHEGAFLGGQLRMTGFEATLATPDNDADQSRPMLQRVR